MVSGISVVPRLREPALESAVRRLWEGLVPGPNGCWTWTGRTNDNGYGVLEVGSRVDRTKGPVLIHRLAYELGKGPIPDGLEIDHLCRNRRCANISHLEAVTHIVNVHRGNVTVYVPLEIAANQSCKHEHKFTVENTYCDPKGKLHCRRCNADAASRKRFKRWAEIQK